MKPWTSVRVAVSWKEPLTMRAHPAGPRHADVVPGSTPSGPVPAGELELDQLHERVWPRHCVREHDGVVRFAGADVRELTQRFGTPVFLLDEDDFRARCRDYVEAFGDPSAVHYAAKAFLCTELARWVDEEGLSLDVCSGGELNVALRAGFPAERVTFHGNNKSVAELTAAVEAGVGTVVLDSFHELARLQQVAARYETRQRVLVRVTVGVEAHTHEFIATSHEDQKFGFSLSGGQAAEAINRVLKADSLELSGLHSHIGSQIFDVEGFELAAHRVIGLLADTREQHGAEALDSVSTVDLGGGLGIAYTPEDDPLAPAELARRLRETVSKECANANLAVPHIAVEPGRALVGPSMITIYEVGTIKDVALDGGASRRYVSVDGGMSDNIRTALYDAVYDCRLVSRGAQAPPVLSRIVGKHCESGDVVVRDCWLPEDIAPGDLLAVAATGAYCYVMASNYNRLPKPPVAAVRAGQARLLLRRETEDDLLRLEV